MPRTSLLIAAFTLLGTMTAPSLAQDSKWGSPDDPTVKLMIASEAKWADSAPLEDRRRNGRACP